MKRVISLALAATVFLANADDEDALKIARKVYARANLRMMKRTEKSIRLLHKYASSSEKRNDLAELYSNIINYPPIQAQIEIANIKKVKELCKTEVVKTEINEMAEDLDRQVAREEEKINSMYELFLRHYK